MNALSRNGTTRTIQRSSKTLGKKLFEVKGDWSAWGHQFGEDMRCSCGISWTAHQNSPSSCSDSSRYQHLKKKK